MKNKSLIIIGTAIIVLLIINGIFLFKSTGNVTNEENNNTILNQNVNGETTEEQENSSFPQEPITQIDISEQNQEEQPIIISSVIDGDTIQLSTGEEVRLIGINAPEIGEKCYQEAKDFLDDYILGKEVFLERDVEDKDQYFLIFSIFLRCFKICIVSTFSRCVSLFIETGWNTLKILNTLETLEHLGNLTKIENHTTHRQH